MEIGWVPNPRDWERWPEAERLLDPARALGEFESALSGDEILWAVMDGDELLAVATAWLSNERYAEVKLIGGRDYRRWLKQLDEAIGAAAREAGATRMIGIGRAGWWRDLQRMGWAKIGETDPKTWVYSREV